MTSLGKRKEYQQVISNEIADVSIMKIEKNLFIFPSFYIQKVREMEQIDRQRSKALEKRLNEHS
jgi:hypothetical protein